MTTRASTTTLEYLGHRRSGRGRSGTLVQYQVYVTWLSPQRDLLASLVRLAMDDRESVEDLLRGTAADIRREFSDVQAVETAVSVNIKIRVPKRI